MDNQIIISVFELTLSILIGVLSLFLTHYILIKIYKSRTNDEKPYENTAFLIFLSGIIFSMGFLLSGLTTPLSSTLDMLSVGNNSATTTMISFSKYVFIFCFLGFLLGGFINFLTYLLFTNLTTKLNEFEEIKNGNIGVAILVSVIAITIAVFCKEPFLVTLEYFIPYPEIPIIK
tara:strand:+ start:4042 stop:4566 length:525 start_codon:yes stop_codon:yes gene_type:complete